jgi:hypothetical protein
VKAPLNTLLFGGCLLHWPLTRTDRAEGKLNLKRYGTIREVHTFGEMFQTVAILRGEKVMPPELAPLWHMPKLSPVADAKTFSELDLALVEPASPTDLTFRGTVINRNKIKARILDPIMKLGKVEGQVAAKWLRRGLIEMDERVLAETTPLLLSYVRGNSAQDELTRAIISETRASKITMAEGFAKMQELLGCPIGVIVYIFRYMPDGRVISWPTRLREDIIEGAEGMGLPSFDPVPYVVKYGVPAAMTDDSRHYKPDFLPIIGDALVEFAQSVHQGAAVPA